MAQLSGWSVQNVQPYRQQVTYHKPQSPAGFVERSVQCNLPIPLLSLLHVCMYVCVCARTHAHAHA